MKLAANKKVNPNTKRAVITLKRPESKTLEKGQCYTYKRCTSPTSVDSPVYKLVVPFFDKGQAEEWIKFRRNLEAVLKGQNVTSEPDKYAIVKTLLKGYALMLFKTAETAYMIFTVEIFDKCLDDLTSHFFPEKEVQTQKRYMQRYLRLSKGQPVKEWVAQVSELNK